MTTNRPEGPILLIAPPVPVRSSLADALAGPSAHPLVRVQDPAGDCRCGEGRIVTRSGLRDVIDGLAPDALAHLVRPAGDTGPIPFESLDIPEWIRRVHDPLWSLTETLRLAEHGSAPVVVVVESVGLSGAPGTTTSAALAEGARALAKSAARAFGGDGPPVQMVAVDPIVLGSPDVIGETIRPRNRPEPTVGDLADAIHAARMLPPGIGGGLLVVDGGRTMLP